MNTAIVLAGGNSSRMEPFSSLGNKALLSVLGQSFVERTIRMLAQAEMDRVICVIAPRDKSQWEELQKALSQELHLELVLIEQSEAKGMGNALLPAREFVNDDFLTLFPYHYEHLNTVQQLRQSETEAVVVTPTDNPQLYGIATFDPKTKKLQSIVEKPQQTTTPIAHKLVGLYRLSTSFLDYLSDFEGEYSFETALHQYAQQASIHCVEVKSDSLSLKYSWHLFDHLELLLKNQLSQTHNELPYIKIDETDGPVVLSKNCLIGAFTSLKGPLCIGDNVRIGDHCMLRSSSIEAGATIGSYTEVVRSLIMSDVTVHQSYVADSVIGPRSHIGAGFLTTNKRLDGQTIRAKIKGAMVDSLRKKLGVCVGPDVTIGSRVMIMPGTIISENTVVAPGTVLPATERHHD